MNEFDGILQMEAWDGMFSFRFDMSVNINPEACPYENDEGYLMFRLDGKSYNVYEALTLKIVLVKEVKWQPNSI